MDDISHFVETLEENNKYYITRTLSNGLSREIVKLRSGPGPGPRSGPEGPRPKDQRPEPGLNFSWAFKPLLYYF